MGKRGYLDDGALHDLAGGPFSARRPSGCPGLAGDRPRGTLYAVYTFLEDMVGCRWWSSSESFTPQLATLEIPELNTVYVPKLLCREAFYRDAFDGVYAARSKCNGHFERIAPEYGGHYTILGWCHTFYQILPPDTYFAAHPEWYSEIGGKRTFDRAQLCLTNEEMRAEFVKNALEWIRKDPTSGIISISQNDCGGACACAKCAALQEQEGAASGPIIHFVNAVAEAIEQEFPDMLIETLAYSYTRHAPKHVKPRENVLIRLCSIECSFAQAAGHRPAECVVQTRHRGLERDCASTVHLGLRDGFRELHHSASESARVGAEYPLLRKEQGHRPIRTGRFQLHVQRFSGTAGVVVRPPDVGSLARRQGPDGRVLEGLLRRCGRAAPSVHRPDS